MKGERFTVTSYKFDLSPNRSWTARLLEETDEHLILEGFFEHEIRHPDLGLIAKGTRSVETFFLDRWYNYFVFYEPAGELRNYYINIALPPKIGRGTVDYVDLDIDVLVWPDGRIDILDEEEFAENVLRFDYPADVIQNVNMLKEQIHENPFVFVTRLPAIT